jgi:MSHA biogenesis protein MshP
MIDYGFSMSAQRHRQRGVSIIAAIFLLLLFAALAAFMVSMTSTANMTSAQDVQGVRAYQAAQAGVEWGLFQLDPNDTAVALPACFANTPLGQIPGFTVDVSCARFGIFTEGGATVAVYQIVARARVTDVAPGVPVVLPAAVEREAEARVAKCLNAAVGPRIFNC